MQEHLDRIIIKVWITAMILSTLYVVFQLYYSLTTMGMTHGS